jgi:hypothetical protein
LLESVSKLARMCGKQQVTGRKLAAIGCQLSAFAGAMLASV